MNTLHIVRGLPGTGKTTFAQKKFGGMLQLENDQYWITPDGKYEYDEKNNPRERCSKYVKTMVVTAMQNKVNLVVSRVGMSEKSVRELVELAQTFDYDFKIWLMSSENRRIFKNVHNVPKVAIKLMEDGFVYQLPWPQVIVGITMEEQDHDFDCPAPPPVFSYDFHDIPASKEGHP